MAGAAARQFHHLNLRTVEDRGRSGVGGEGEARETAGRPPRQYPAGVGAADALERLYRAESEQSLRSGRRAETVQQRLRALPALEGRLPTQVLLQRRLRKFAKAGQLCRRSLASRELF